MNYELIGILLLGAGQLIALVYASVTHRETQRIQRAIAGLIVQESEKVQSLMRAGR